MTPTIAALTILSKFQNDIKNSENRAASFCLDKVGSVKLIMDKFEPLVGTSSTYLMPGEEMTVIAGLGSFNSNARPEVTIDGRSIAPNASGVAETKFSVGGTGSKSMNVVVKFIDPNTGEAKTVTKQINYTVGAPSGVAVSPNKMNVLYVGVDNPVTITAGAGSEKVSAQFSGGSISKSSGNQYVIRPSSGAFVSALVCSVLLLASIFLPQDVFSRTYFPPKKIAPRMTSIIRNLAKGVNLFILMLVYL
jgi:gliding motility-associated protein GldM